MVIPRFTLLCVLLIGALASLAPTQQTTWTGAVSRDWSDPGNWSAGVPQPTVSAFIPSTTRQPRTDSGGLSCRDLSINSSAALELSDPSQLEVHGNLSLSGLVSGPGGLRLVGSGNIDARNPWLQTEVEINTPGGIYTVGGDLFRPVRVSAGTLSCVGGNFRAPVSVVGGILEFTSNGPIFSSDLTVSGTGQLNALPSSTVTLSAVGGQTLSLAGGSFERLTLATGARATVVGSLVVNDDLSIDTVALLDVGGSLRADGDVTIEGELRVQGASIDFGTLTPSADVRVDPTGTLSAPAAVLDVGPGGANFSSTSSVTLGAGRHRFSGVVNIDTSVGFSGPATIALTGTGQFSSGFGDVTVPVEVEATAGAWEIRGTLDGDLLVLGGAVALSSATLRGSATVQGGSLEVRSNQTHEFWSDFVVQAPGQLIAASNSTIEFTGFGARTFDPRGAAVENLIVERGLSVMVPGSLAVNGSMSVSTAASLDLAGSLRVGPRGNIAGTVDVGGSSLEFSIGASSSSSISSTGRVRAPNAQLLIGTGGLSMTAGSSLSVAAGRHTTRGPTSLLGSVSFAGPAVLGLEGTGSLSAGPGSLPASVEVDSGAGAWTVSGTYDGLFSVFGGSVTLLSSTFREAVVVDGGVLEFASTIRFERDFTVATSGQLLVRPNTRTILDGPSGQTIDTNGVDFEDLTVAVAARPTFPGSLVVRDEFVVGNASVVEIAGSLRAEQQSAIDGEVRVQGSSVELALTGTRQAAIGTGHLLAPSALLTVGVGGFSLGSNAILTLGPGRHVLTDSVSIQSPVTFTGSAVLDLQGDGSLNLGDDGAGAPIELAATAGTWTFSGTFDRAFRILGGTARNTNTTDFLGPVTVEGGILELQSFRSPDFDNDLIVTSPGQLVIEPGTSTDFGGSGAQTIDTNGTPFESLRIESGAHPSFSGSLVVRLDLTLQPASSLDVPGSLRVDRSLTVSGELRVQGSSIDLVGGGQSFSRATFRTDSTVFAPGALLTLSGGVLDIESRASITLGPGRHSLTGSIDVESDITFTGPASIGLDGDGDASFRRVPLSIPLDFGPASGTWSVSGTFDESVTVRGGVVQFASSPVFRAPVLVTGGMLQWDGAPSVQDDLTVQSPGLLTLGASSNLVLAGVAGQTIDTGGAEIQRLTVAAGARPAIVGPLVVRGTFSSQSGSILDVGGDLDVGGTGSSSWFGWVRVAGTSVTSDQLIISSVGRLLAPAATLAVTSGSLNVSNGGHLSLGGGQHTVAGDVSLSGPNVSFARGATLLVSQTATVSSSATAALPSLQLGTLTDGPGAIITIAGGTTIQGDLLQLSGQLETTSGTVTVTQDALFRGATVFSNSSSSRLDVGRDIEFSTTAVVDQPPRILECGRDWTSNPNFNPLVGTVFFDGPGLQSANAVNLPVFDLLVESGTQLTLNVDNLLVRNDAQIDARVQAGQVSTRIDGELSVGAGGEFELLTGTHEVLGDVVNDGLVSGPEPLRFIGTGTVSGAGQFADVEIDTSSQITATSDVEIANLELLTGTLDVSGSNVVHTNGNTDLIAGTLSGSASATLDCDGDFTATGTLAAATTPNITVAGNYAATDTFQPQTGEVTLNPTGTSTLTSLSPSGQLFFPLLRITEGIAQILASLELRTTQVEIEPMGRVQVEPGAQAGFTCLGLGIDGTFRVLGGAEVRWDAQTVAVVESGGRFELFGDPTATARVLPDVTSGWSLTVQNGATFEARFFEMRGMSDAGVVIESGATVLMSSGIFADGSSAAGAVLLDMSRDKGDQYDGIVFDTASGSTPFNATTGGPGTVTFTNYVGDPLQELDPSNLIEWIGAGQTGLQRFSALGDLGAVDISWQTNREILTTQFRLFREVISTGNVVEVVGSPVTAQGSVLAGASYALRDTGVPSNERLRYELFEERPSMAQRSLGTVEVTPWPAQVGATGFVGPGGFSDIGAALAANGGSFSSIIVSAGSYPSFTVDRSVRILAREGSLVTIDTSAGPLEIRDAATGDVALYGLRIGDPSNLGPDALTITNVDAVVVIDECEVAATVQAAAITDSPKVAVQQSTFAGGLSIDGASTTSIANGTVDLLTVGAGTNTEYLGTTIGVANVDPAASLIDLGGSAPRMDFQQQWSELGTIRLAFTGEPGGIATVLAAEGPDYLDLTGLFGIDMPLLLSPATSFPAIEVPTPLDANGEAVSSLFLPTLTNLTGISIPTQLITLSFRGATLGNVRDLVIVP